MNETAAVTAKIEAGPVQLVVTLFLISAICAVLLGLGETGLNYAGTLQGFGTSYTPVFTFLIMLVFLLVRPRGIAGSHNQEKA